MPKSRRKLPSSPKTYAEVALPFTPLPATLTYAVPDKGQEACKPGRVVVVPWKERQELGVVVGLQKRSPVPTREIIQCTKLCLSHHQVQLAEFLHQIYLAPWALLLTLFLPQLKQVCKPTVVCCTNSLNPLDPWDACFLKRKRLRVATLKQKFKGQFEPLLKENLRATRFKLTFQIEKEIPKRKAFPKLPNLKKPCLTLTQQKAYQELVTESEERNAALFLGVPGAGKTEVYLRYCYDLLQKQRSVLVLVPEIVLTPQLKARIEETLGVPVALFHSYLGDALRLKLWREIEAGAWAVVLGARSSLFLEIPRLGMIVVDEEQEASYKNEQYVRYHARDVARKKAQIQSAFCLFVSATPSCEVYALAEEKKIGKVILKEKYGKAPLPKVEIVSLREKRKEALFHPKLLKKIQERLARREQVVLLYNRRGFTPYLLCLYCGAVVHCPNCDVSLVYHRTLQKYLCHHCGLRQEKVTKCPTCGGPHLKRTGFGTERLEERLKELFAGATVSRVDLDALQEKTLAEELDKMQRGEISILLGTQMVAKGLDFGRVTLAGILSFEQALNMPDFRSEERTFQLLAQLAGRSGRGCQLGEVIIQAFKTDTPLLEKVKNFAVEDFLREELARRKALHFPPYVRLLRIEIAHPNKKKTEALAQKAKQFFHFGTAQKKRWEMRRGWIEASVPVPCPIFKKQRRYRYHFFMKSSPPLLERSLVQQFLNFFGHEKRYLKIDFEPIQML